MRVHRNLIGLPLAALVVAGLMGRASQAQDCLTAVSDNGEFQINFVDFEHNPDNRRVTLFYEVCKLGCSPEVKDLSHWSISLESFIGCGRPGCGPRDLVPLCGQTAPYCAGDAPGPFILEGENNPDAPVCEIGIDPRTGTAGLKFDDLDLGDGECQQFCFIVDLNCLRRGVSVRGECVEASFKAGNQDINGQVPPGYASICGIFCEAN